MNSDTIETAEQCAKDAGAVVKCPVCGGSWIDAGDPDAESQTYASATNLWKDGVRGFRGMESEEVMDVVKRVLQDANSNCPSCTA